MGVAERGFLNRRRAQRLPVLLPASVVTMSAYQYFDVIDLSATGAKLRGQAVPPFGRAALFRVDGFQTLCKIVWAVDGLCGVHFDELIPMRVLERFREAGTTAEVEMLAPSQDQPETARGNASAA
ncbi:PilZ domain-containing protein [Sphingomonas sp. URHD0057]|uniref:PilZ domain-containing protein n=1 Tax=Sphingomonas sp. URHD0057 TaxID=1380389 RepID=UPI0012DCEF12|nr:PilZ domain-containing protein [Sphingomonas sp. URHD0057]